MTSSYYKVRCNCGSEQTVFSHLTSILRCTACQEPLAHPSGGKAIIHGEVIEELG